MDFVPYIEALFPAMLMGITGAASEALRASCKGDKDQNEDHLARGTLSS